jgi:hypothetical protein
MHRYVANISRASFAVLGIRRRTAVSILIFSVNHSHPFAHQFDQVGFRIMQRLKEEQYRTVE